MLTKVTTMATDAMTSVKLVQLIAQARQRWEEEDENMGCGPGTR